MSGGKAEQIDRFRKDARRAIRKIAAAIKDTAGDIADTLSGGSQQVPVPIPVRAGTRSPGNSGNSPR